MSEDRHDKLLHRDWSSTWDTLPEAPALVPRPKAAQITLRLPAGLLGRIKRVAAAQSLPYHALARSWIIDRLREPASPMAAEVGEAQVEQLNIKLDQDVLDELKARADDAGRPYHRLAREFLQAAVAREEARLGLGLTPAGQPGIKDLMVFLLHAPNARGRDAVRGITRMQKLLFVIEQTLATQGGGFYAYDYGPFSEGINDAAHALALAGFLSGTETTGPGPPTFEEMMATAAERSGPREQQDVQEFALNEVGHNAAEELRQSSRAYQQLFAAISTLREEWDTPDLVERVYETWPKYAKRSLIADEIAERRKRRSKG